VLWEALAGERLYSAETDAERIRKVREGAVPPLEQKRDGLPDGLHAIVETALAREPDRRFPSAEAMGHALLRLLGGEPVGPRELGQSVVDARVALGMSARSGRAPPAPTPSSAPAASPAPVQAEDAVRMARVVVLKQEE
jgi:hypothetical protein